MKKIICLYGGPGAGKSTTASGLDHTLRARHFNVEMNREYVKEWVWEGREVGEGDQTYFFSKQSRRERIYMRKGMDFIVTDSPLILTHFYGLKYDWMEQNFNTSKVMLEHHHAYCKRYGYKTEHFLIQRDHPYNPNGRNQGEDEARGFDGEIQTMLEDFGIKYHRVTGNDSAVPNILKLLGVE